MQNRLEKPGEHFVQEELCRVEEHFGGGWVAAHGYCRECGAKIDPKRLRPSRLILFCLDCEEAAERMLLLSAVFGS